MTTTSTKVGTNKDGHIVLTDENGKEFIFYTVEAALAFLQATKLKHVKHEEKQ